MGLEVFDVTKTLSCTSMLLNATRSFLLCDGIEDIEHKPKVYFNGLLEHFHALNIRQMCVQ